MDELLDLATQLASQPPNPLILPIRGRVAYVISHGQSYISNEYTVRTHGVAQWLNQHGMDTLCFVRPGHPWELGMKLESESIQSVVKGVRYIHSFWPRGEVPQGDREHLEASVACFVELFRIYRPACVLAASDWVVGLPAWIAAKRLGLPFFNELSGIKYLSDMAVEPGDPQTQSSRKMSVRDHFVAGQAESVFTLGVAIREEPVWRTPDLSRLVMVSNLKRRLGIDKGDRVVGWIGSFSPYEGLDLLLEACTELVQDGEKLKLLLVGHSQSLIDSSAAHLVETCLKENPPWLIQVGRVPHEQVADYYALLDAVVIPRKPLAVCQLVPHMKAAEALAYGKRLVVSDVAPLAEYAQKYDGVVSFEAGSAKSLATALQRSLKLPAPKPSTELLFSAHTELMVRALKGEGSAPGQKPAVEPTAKAVEKKSIEHRPLSFVESEVVDYSYGEAIYADGREVSSRFYDLSREGLAWGFGVEGFQEIDIFFNLKLANAAASFVALKEVVAKIEFYDASGNLLSPSSRIPKSPSIGSYVYLKFSERGVTNLRLPVPSSAHHLRISAIKWGAGKEVYISNVAHFTGYKKGVSIIIPSYKGEGTIRECLDSLAAQSLAKKDFEVVVILNGEPDSTENIIDRFKKENPEINLLLTRNEVAGAGAARNHGISLASREYVTFIDDDDFVSEGFLQGLVGHSAPNEIVISNIEDFNESGFFESSINQQVKRASGSGQVSYEKITSAVTLNACKLVPTKFVKSVKYNELLKSGEDVDYWTRLVCLFNPCFRCVDEMDAAIYYRRVRENSVSRQAESFEFNVKQRLEVVAELEKIVASNDLQAFVNSKVDAQLGFVNRYLEKNPSEWERFKELAEQLDISPRAFQYVNEKQSKTLVISYCFPPYIDTAGIVCAKRIIQSNKPVDVISNTMKGVRERDDSLWKLVKPYVGRFQEIQAYPSFSNWKAIEEFCKKAVTVAERNVSKYTDIYSRSMWPGSHFAAALLKIKHPELRWVAEFSDPLRVDVQGQERHVEMSSDWLVKNGFSRKIEEAGFGVDDNSCLFYWCEMLPYIFSDEFVFTNSSQKAYMLNMLIDEGLKQRVEERSLVSQHPTLPDKFYGLSGYEYPLDSSKVNIGYFGSFYVTRGIGEVLRSLNTLPQKEKEKIRVHIFTPTPESISIVESLKNNVVVNKILPYLDFLSVSKRFDALVVNDAETRRFKWINPYLPSKLSDYRGSGASIWALFEEGSELSHFGSDKGVVYKSRIGDEEQVISVLTRLAVSVRNKIK